MPRWGMVIDLTRCSGCTGCHAACKAENATPPGVTWARLEYLELGTFPNVRRVPLPLLCMHCAEPECERVCPTGATYQRDDGIVKVDADLCVGCKSCMLACPYGARYMYDEPRTYFPGHLLPHEAAGRDRHVVGAVSKCDFCSHILDAGVARGLTPGEDRAATPACVTNCWCRARIFGDLNDPNSRVAQLVASGQAIQLRPEKGTEPRVYYLAPSRGAIAHLNEATATVSAGS